MNLFEPLLLLLTIAFVVVVVVLRRLLGFVVPISRVRLVPAGAPPAAMADLLDEAGKQLHELGFAEPLWLLLDHQPVDAVHYRVSAVLRHIESGELLMLGPPMNPARPHQLTIMLASRLRDGRVLLSQWFDPYTALLSSAPVQGRMAHEGTLAEFWASHGAWVRSQGEVEAIGAEPEALRGFAEDLLREQRAGALAEGRLVLDRGGQAVLSWGSALRALQLSLFGRKPPPLARNVPVARLSWLAAVNERQQLLAPGRFRQWSLFLFSVVLFVALGAMFWDLQLALVLLVVIGIHESGHFLAMRALGYRNTQMLALPLVGGVAIGHEDEPRAAGRAWMSLAGPVPGIVIGWVLLALTWFGDWQLPWLSQAAWVFLAVNYLNVLPIPPLDGGHVVQALLPQRFAQTQAMFLLLACSIGAIAAWYLDFTLLLVVFAMNLLQVPTMFRNARVMKHLLRSGAIDRKQPRPQRLRQVLQAFENLAGPTPLAMPRINAAEGILRGLDMQPMNGWNRAAISGVLLACVAVPVAAWIWWFSAIWTSSYELDTVSLSYWKEQYEVLTERAKILNIGELARGVSQTPTWVAPTAARSDQIDAAQERLGLTLPTELIELYRYSAAGLPEPRLVGGLPEPRLVGLAELQRLRDAEAAGALPDWFNDSAEFYLDDDSAELLKAADLRDSLLLDAAVEAPGLFLYQPAAPPKRADPRVLLVMQGEAFVYSSLHEWLSQQWITQQMQEKRKDRERPSVD